MDEATGENSTTVIGRHGCYSSLDHLSQYGASCDQTGAFGNTCFEVDADHLKPDSTSNDTIILAEICLCDTDRCNSDDPIPPIPTTTAASGPSKTCYNCGYKCNDMVNCIITFSFTIVIFRRVPPAHQSPLILKETYHSAATLPACPATLRSAATGTSAVVL